MSMFHSVPGVPCAKMERFAGVDTNLRFVSTRLENVFGAKRPFAYVELS